LFDKIEKANISLFFVVTNADRLLTCVMEPVFARILPSATEPLSLLPRVPSTLMTGSAMEMRDNGRGVSDKEIEDKRSFGILGMRERALFIGGRFHIRGVPGVGTGVRVEIPYQTNGGRP
jgi:hypothetical protein